MNIQQKVLQMTSKRKEKESQKAAQDSSVDHYEEIQKNLTDEQKRLISKYFPKLVNIMTQKVIPSMFFNPQPNFAGRRRVQPLQTLRFQRKGP